MYLPFPLRPGPVLFFTAILGLGFSQGRGESPGTPAPADNGASRDGDRELPAITPYRDGKAGAVSLTFDDGFRHQVADTRAILDPLGIRGTFFIIPFGIEDPGITNMVTWDEVREIHDSGHEIGTHGQIREKLHEATDERLDELVNGSYRLIVEKTGIVPVSYAAPGGSKPAEREYEVIHQNHPVIRTSRGAYALPGVTIRGYGNTDSRKWEDGETRRAIRETVGNGGWFVGVLHAIKPGTGWSPFEDEEDFRRHAAWLAEQEDIWIAPLGEVGLYILARQAATLEILERAPGVARLRLTIDHPRPAVQATSLTIAIPAPGATKAQAEGPPGATATIRDGFILVNSTAGEIRVAWE